MADTFSLPAAHYDRAILHPATRALFDGTGFYNVGFWRTADGGAADALGTACTRLVDLHVAADEARAGVGTVLDVGCGLGATTERFAAAYPGATTVGINYSPAQLRQAARDGREARFVASDATRLAVRSGSVDRIHAVEAAIHFAPRAAFLAEAARVLVPGGRLILTDILPTGPGAVVPAENVVAGLDGYRATCRASGLEVLRLDDITADTVTPFVAHLRRRGLANVARFFTATVDRYVLAVLAR